MPVTPETRPIESNAPTSPSELSVSIVTSEPDFLNLREDWERVLAETAGYSPYLVWAWLEAWWTSFGNRCPRSNLPGRLYVVVVRQGTLPVAIFPFYYLPRRWALGIKRLRPIGYGGELGPADMTEEPLVVIRKGFEQAAVKLVSAHLAETVRQGQWDGAVMRVMEPQAKLMFPPLKHSVSNGLLTVIKNKPGSQIVNLPDSWDAYRKSLSKSMRDNIPYYPRLIVRKGHTWDLHIAQERDETAPAVQTLVKLHKLRVAKGRGPAHHDHFPRKAQERFFIESHQTLAVERQAFIAVLNIDGQPAAAQGFMESGGTLLVSYSGFDPQFARFSPLFVLETLVFQAAMGRGIRRLNLLLGAAAWQERWQPVVEAETVKYAVVSMRPVSFVRAVLYFIARETAAFWRREVADRFVRRQWLESAKARKAEN